MKRLFGKFSRSQARSENEAKDAALPSSEETAEADSQPIEPQSELPSSVSAETADDAEAPAFELREPTPEEISATILSRQDFVDLDRMFAGNGSKRTVHLAKPPVLSPAVAKPVKPASAAVVPPIVAEAPQPLPPSAPVSPEQPTANVASPAPAAEAPPVVPSEPVPDVPKKANLRGFWEGFVHRQFLNGWAGDPDDPACRSLQVSAILDGKVIATVVANIERTDTSFAGWQIPFPDPLVWKYIVENRLAIRFAREGDRPGDMKVLPVVLDAAKALEAKEAKAASAVPAAPEPYSAQDLSFVRLPVGTIAQNGAVILGRDGFLFGYRGFGDLDAQYSIPADTEIVQRDAARWFTLFRSREALLSDRKIAYLQTILPEKATILPDLAPAEHGQITPRLGVLEAIFAAEAKKEGGSPFAYYRSLIAPMRSCYTAGVAPYLRTGSGLRTAGTQFVFYQLVQRMAALLPGHADALAIVIDLCGQLAPGPESEPFIGDLGQQFDFPIYENEQLPDLEKILPHVAGDANVIDRRPTGSRFVWHNPKAPTTLKVMAFGTCLGRGGNAASLTWWFKAMFGEFHLIEQAELDHTYIDQHKPDLVFAISQERTLPSVPSA